MAQPARVLRRGDYDCTLGGVSSKSDTLMVLGPNEPFVGPYRDPVVRVIANRGSAGTIRIVPVDDEGNELDGWSMFGGNFLYSSDARFHEACDQALAESYIKVGLKPPVPCHFYGAVAIHDRFE
jgi:hypothetical protein